MRLSPSLTQELDQQVTVLKGMVTNVSYHDASEKNIDAAIQMAKELIEKLEVAKFYISPTKS